METREQLEDALATSFDRETLAVYADHLLADNDPRGELIALDLQLDVHGRASSALVARRASLLQAWLGSLSGGDPTRGWIGDHVRFGFLDELELGPHAAEQQERLAAILASPIGRYIRAVSLREVVTSDIAKALAQLARVRHPWLTRLAIDKRANGPAVHDELAARVIAAMPRLARLELSGFPAFETFAHPALRALALDGRACVGALARDAFPGIDLLDVAFGAVGDDDDPMLGIAALAAAELPSLRRLDLSRNERAVTPAVPDDYDEEPVLEVVLDPYPILAKLPWRTKLTHLRLPALRSQADFDSLAESLATMTALVEVEVVRGHYYRAPALPHPTARFTRPPSWPWPAPARIRPGEALRITIPGARSADVVGLADAASAMEARYEALPSDARYAWTRLWLAVEQLGLDREMSFPAELLVQAVEACEVSGAWRELRDELRFRRPLPAGALVAIRRVL